MTSDSHQSDEQPRSVRYYKTDVQGMTYTELRRVFRGWIPFLIMAVVKLLGRHKRLGLGIPHPSEFVPLEPDQLPSRVRGALEPAVAEWRDQGLHPAFYWTRRPDYLGNVQFAAVAMLSDDGALFGYTLYMHVSMGGFSQQEIVSSAGSKMPDGVVLTTTTRSPDYQEAPHRRVQYLVGRTIAAVAAHHRYRLRNIPLEPVRLTPSTLLDFLKQEQRRQVDALIQRGVLVPLSAEEVETERRRLGPPAAEGSMAQAAPRDDSRNPYQSPAASDAPVTSPAPAEDRPIPLAWPLALLWLLWPPIVVFFCIFFAGVVPPLVFFLFIVLASNAGFVESMYRRRLIRRGWVRVLVWVLILIGQIAAAGVAGAAAMLLLWLVTFLPH